MFLVLDEKNVARSSRKGRVSYLIIRIVIDYLDVVWNCKLSLHYFYNDRSLYSISIFSKSITREKFY